MSSGGDPNAQELIRSPEASTDDRSADRVVKEDLTSNEPGWFSLKPETHGWDQTAWRGPILSIVTVIRRDFTGLRKTLDSVRPLVEMGAEHIIVEGDDRSWPEADRLREGVAGLYPQVRWCLHADSGIYDGMNRGVIASAGEWLWFVNAGDVVSADCDVKGLLSALSETSRTAPWAVADVRILDAHGMLQRTASYLSMQGIRSGRSPVHHQGVFVRRESVAITGLFDCRFRISADYNMFLKLCALGRPEPLPFPAVDFTIGGASSNAVRREYENFVARSRVLHRSVPSVLHDVLRLAWRISKAWRNPNDPGLAVDALDCEGRSA